MNKQRNVITPRTLSGFMELLPSEQILFNQMKDKIKNSYEQFGFLPLDTPVIELSEVLLAKAGGETEKQIYRFNKGDNDLSLRFDLTVPLAKYVALNYDKLAFPFRRYQIGKVYRGERPQKGRFREFYQCDIDIIGDGELSILNDAEIPSIIYNTFKSLGFNDFTICINNRKILNGLFNYLGLNDISVDVLRIIDKIDKIGVEETKKELLELSINPEKVDYIMQFITIDGTNSQKLQALKELRIDNEMFSQGLNELEQVIYYIGVLNVPEKNYSIDLKIARGLDYYTGTVYETRLDSYPELGSVCSGGRYDNLAEFYTTKKLPGVGISIGLTRLFYKLNELNIISSNKKSIADVIVIPMDEKGLAYSLKVASTLRENGINTEVYSANKKIKAKFKYADKLSIPYVIVVGDDEISSNTITVKDMIKGDQNTSTVDGFVEVFKSNCN